MKAEKERINEWSKERRLKERENCDVKKKKELKSWGILNGWERKRKKKRKKEESQVEK